MIIKKDVYFYKEKYYYKVLNQDSLLFDSWPGKDITEKNNKYKLKNSKYIDPLAYKDKIKTLPYATEISIDEHAFTLKLNNKEYIAYVVSALTGKDRFNKKSWEYGMIYVKFGDVCQIGELITTQGKDKNITQNKSSWQEGNSGEIPAKPVVSDKAYISSGYYRNSVEWIDKKTGFYKLHRGIDIPFLGEEDVVARAMFKVKFRGAGPKEGKKMDARGYYVEMEIEDAGPYNDLYKGNTLIYMHLAEKPIIPENTIIKAGDKVGIVGKTGSPKYVIHLHLEMLDKKNPENGDPDDPDNYGGSINLNQFFKEQDWYPTQDGYLRDNKYLDVDPRSRKTKIRQMKFW